MQTLKYAAEVSAGIYAIDTGFERPHFDASYLLIDAGEAAFIDVGTNYSSDYLLHTLHELGLTEENVKYIILTHIHLDHAGGAGKMMQECSKALLIVHPRGVRHMIDPAALRAGAVGVYGEDKVQQTYGELLSIEASRILEAQDQSSLKVGQRELICIDTPGHAKHHISIWDSHSQGVFTGDTFGLSYREFDTDQGPFVMPTTTPIQFDPEALKKSIDRICSLKPQSLFPTHYSRIDGVPRLKTMFLTILDEMVELALHLQYTDDRHNRIKEGLFKIYLSHLKQHGVKMQADEIKEFLDIDLELNAQGIGVWLNQKT